MMNLDNYYLHATGGFLGEKNKNNNIIKILKDGKIKPNGFDGYAATPIGKICLCDPIKYSQKDKNDYRDFSFESFVLYSPSIAISRNLSVVSDDFDHADEVLFSGEIPFELFEFVTFPVLDPRDRDDISTIKRLTIFKEAISIISNEFRGLHIKDIYTGKDITEEDIDQQMEKYQKIIEKKKSKFPNVRWII